jgi:uncharacterized surface protein with fasciclin (FAS1) repeats
MRTIRMSRSMTSIVLALSAAAVLGACSSSSKSSDTTSSSAETTTTMSAPTTMAANNTIVDIAASNPDFSTLVTAVKAAGLADTLAGPGPFTVFAPTNEAFAKLPAATLQSLLEPQNKQQLANILTYHVVGAKVMAADVQAGKVKTVSGAEITIGVSGGNVTITDGQGNVAKVIKTDIVASNGVIHVIDTVLLPPKS